MADDPFANYKSPSTSTDPFAGYKPPDTGNVFTRVAADQPPAFANPTDQQPPLDPRTATTGDYLTRLQQQAQTVDDYVRRATNVFGLGDRFSAAMTNLTGIGPSAPTVANVIKEQVTGQPSDALSRERALTDAASARLGPLTYAADMTGFGPFARLGMAGNIARGIAPAGAGAIRTIVGNALGTGAEGASATYLAALGHGASPDEAARSALKGGAISAAVGGVAGPGRPEVPGPLAPRPISDLEAETAANYAKMKQVGFDPAPVDQAYRKGVTSLEDDQVSNVSDPFKNLIKKQRSMIGATSQPTASNINGYARALGDAATTNADRVLAARIKDNLNGVLENATPTTGHAVGEAADMQDAANASNAKLQDVNRLQDMQTKAQRGGLDVGTQAKQWLPGAEAQRYAPEGSAQFQTMQDLAATSPKGEYVPWWVKHFVLAPIAGTAASEGVQAMTGQTSPWTHVLGDIGAGAALGMGSAGFGRYTAGRNRADQQDALVRAQIAASTGQTPGRTATGSPTSDLLRQAVLAHQAAQAQ